MRDILFRGKSNFEYGNTKKGDWLYGMTIARHCYNDEEITSYYIGSGNKTIDGKTLGQYTGLTDKNGTKIFEGDYWLDTDDDYLVYVVEFRDGQFGFVCYGIQGVLMPYGFDEDAGDFGEIDFSPFTDWNMDSIEINGNIHDNPEVLNREMGCGE